jgi:hypothetical protein
MVDIVVKKAPPDYPRVEPMTEEQIVRDFVMHEGGLGFLQRVSGLGHLQTLEYARKYNSPDLEFYESLEAQRRAKGRVFEDDY